jgi:hypothetical protein
MLVRDWIGELKPGDEVAVIRNYGRLISVARVIRVTPSGRVIVHWGSSSLEFNPDGYQRGNKDSWSRTHIEPLTPERRDAADQRVLAERLEVTKWGALDVATLRRVAAALEGE